ncbi:hypothetical protein ACFCYH_12915 [Streptomyces sp. NPDC056400]|uniref:AMP-binding enzyme n=1 Tax=Streptomyces sp. NPDC056400 TaxID=3345808 RepID=UPI0035DDD746
MHGQAGDPTERDDVVTAVQHALQIAFDAREDPVEQGRAVVARTPGHAGELVPSRDGELKDMYVVGGFNAYPAEVENVLLTHPAITDAAVVGAPDDRLGEVGVAYVVTSAPVTAAELTAWTRERLANSRCRGASPGCRSSRATRAASC